MHNYRFLEAYNSWKECYAIGLQKVEKKLVKKELKQIWNSAVAIVIAVATIAVAILEQRQRKFCTG